jgi:hypothetical protein
LDVERDLLLQHLSLDRVDLKPSLVEFF